MLFTRGRLNSISAKVGTVECEASGAVLEGIAELPLHEGHVPGWLAWRMRRLAKAIVLLLIDEYGPRKLVERLANPLWFQALNNVIGMDWDSSGSTTVTLGILKQVLWEEPEAGVLIAGGKGKAALRVPEEAKIIAERYGLDADKLIQASRLAAKVDSAALQDGYQLYHHCLIVSEDGSWCVVHQGMNVEVRLARRYHWLNKASAIEPHAAIAASRREAVVLDTTSSRSKATKAMLDALKEDPGRLERMLRQAINAVRGQMSLDSFYITPTGTGVVGIDSARRLFYAPLKLTRRLLESLRRAREAEPRRYEDLLLVRGVGPATVRALALIADVIYGEPPSYVDPANAPYDPFRYAYAVGGKDGVPFPIDRRLYDEVLSVLEEAVAKARLGERERVLALKRLRRLAYLSEELRSP